MFGLGAFLLYTAETIRCVMIGRFVVGWAVAVSGIADVGTYFCAPKKGKQMGGVL